MEPRYHSPRIGFLLICAISTYIGGCGEQSQSAKPNANLTPPVIAEVQPAPVTQAPQMATEPTHEQEFKAKLEKAEAGDAEAQNMVAKAYYYGDAVNKDLSKAAEWYRKAAEQGYADAQYHLGTMYSNAKGVPLDSAKAIRWYHKAAEQGQAFAQIELGFHYQIGFGVTKDITKAMEWYRKGAMKAVGLYQEAAEQGDADAQFKLGQIYGIGAGVPKDTAKAMKWFHMAAEQGDAESQTYIGLGYSSGSGLPKDVVLAYTWLNLAASAGSEKAIQERDKFESSLLREELQEAQRLASQWKQGQRIVREGKSSTDANAPAGGSPVKIGTGTIFVVSKAGHAITNQHVAGGCRELRVQGRDGLATLLNEDKVNDLALLQLQGAVTDAANIAAEPGKLRQGDEIAAFGFPLKSVLSSGGNLTPGVVSALSGLGNNINQIQITAPIQPGSSGSPVLNKKGEVVGVVSRKLDDGAMVNATGHIGQNINFAISGQTLKTFLDTHKVPYSTSGGFLSREKSMADLADEARKWTYVVECWK